MSGGNKLKLCVLVKGFDNKHAHRLCGDNFTQPSENRLDALNLFNSQAVKQCLSFLDADCCF